MPIRPELRKFYGREWRTVTRPRILARAGHCCEQCGVPNYATITRIDGAWLEVKASWELGVLKLWRDGDGTPLSKKPEGRKRVVDVVLAVAHVNHTPGDDTDENLRAWCQWCHLHHDAPHHAETRSARKDAARPILAALEVIAERASADLAADGRADTPQLKSLKRYLAALEGQ